MFRFLTAIVWFFISLYLFTLPGNRLPKYTWFDRVHGDKLVHMGIFAVLVFLFLRALAPAGFKLLRTAFALALAAMCYGIAIEFIQKYFIPYRSFEVTDIAADTAGSFLPYFACMLRTKKVAKQ